MTQDIGAETNRKNRGIPKAVCRDFFNSFLPKPQSLATSRGAYAPSRVVSGALAGNIFSCCPQPFGGIPSPLLMIRVPKRSWQIAGFNFGFRVKPRFPVGLGEHTPPARGVRRPRQPLPRFRLVLLYPCHPGYPWSLLPQSRAADTRPIFRRFPQTIFPNGPVADSCPIHKPLYTNHLQSQ